MHKYQRGIVFKAWHDYYTSGASKNLRFGQYWLNNFPGHDPDSELFYLKDNKLALDMILARCPDLAIV
jgi:hypothetical protein